MKELQEGAGEGKQTELVGGKPILKFHSLEIWKKE